MKTPVGARVGALSHGEEDRLYLFGYGVYLGELYPPLGTPGLFGTDASELGVRNPCIKLDNGKIVWGCQCWWGPEEAIKKKVITSSEVLGILPKPLRDEVVEVIKEKLLN